MTERTHVDVRFRGQVYRVGIDHAHMLSKRGHLRSHTSGHPARVTYYMDDDRCIEVVGEPLEVTP
jgi:hypothetical protein